MFAMDTARTKQLNVRVPISVHERFDRLVAELSGQKGVALSKADVFILMLSECEKSKG